MNLKDWFPRMPKFRWPMITIHVPTWIYLWSVYMLCMGGMCWVLGHGFVSQMFEILATEVSALVAIVALAFIPTFVWAFCEHWAEFMSHKKKHAGDEETDQKKKVIDTFAIVPQLVIPVLFIAFAELVALFATSFLAGRVELTAEEVATIVAFLTFAIYCGVQTKVGANVENAAFYKMVEAKVYAKSVAVAEDIAEKAGLTERIAAYKAKGYTQEQIDEILLATGEQ